MLSAPYLNIKHLRSTGKGSAAFSLLRSTPPLTDEDAFEAAVCLFVCGDIDSALHVCQSHAWQALWARDITQALTIFLRDGDPVQALPLARRAVSGSGHDGQAIFLMLLQANSLIEEADAYIQRHLPEPPLGESLLLTIMAEIAAAVADWRQAYRLACAVVAADPDDFRALLTLSIVNYETGNTHESLGNALRASLINPQSQQAILRIMRCQNSLGDYYATVAAFDRLSGTVPAAPDLHVELGIAYAGLECKTSAVAALRTAIAGGTPPLAALRALMKIHAGANETVEVQALTAQYPDEINNDMECLLALGLAHLQHGDVDRAQQVFDASFALAREQNLAADLLPWPVPEPRVRHDYEQLELLARRGRLDAAGRSALNTLKRYGGEPGDVQQSFAPSGGEADLLQRALTAVHYVPDTPFTGSALGDNDYRGIEDRYFASRPSMVVIDNFLSPDALAALRRYSEEATVWKMNNNRGYVGALIAQGFSPRVLLAIAHELKQALPHVIGEHALAQAWGFKYDQRMQGINMHADFAKINVNFWITPDQACQDNTTGGMVIYDVPAPPSWTFADYNTNQSKMMAYLKVHNAQSLRVPYRENRCVLFDSSLIHITDELHFRPGYENRRVNVTLLYGRARSQG